VESVQIGVKPFAFIRSNPRSKGSNPLLHLVPSPAAFLTLLSFDTVQTRRTHVLPQNFPHPPSCHMRNSLEPLPRHFTMFRIERALMPDKPAPPCLTLEIEHTDDVTIVRCHGQLVSELSNIFYSKIRPIIPVTKRIVLDLSDVTRMDSMGLGTLVGLYTSARAAGCEMQLLNIGKRIRELLGLTNLLSVFTIIGEHGVRL